MKNDRNIKSGRPGILYGIKGFVILFLVYHLPEFLQNNYKKPLILVLELGMLLFALISFYIGRRWHHNGLRIYGFYSFRKNWGNLILGLIIGIFLAGSANLFPVLFGWSRFSLQLNLGQILLQTLIFSIGTLLPSLGEDILTRGYLRVFWPENLNIKWLILISAAVYVLNHIFRLTKPDVMLYLLILGYLLMWCYVKTGTLWLTLGIHWGTNIAYQCFTNLVSFNPIKETGMENYILAASYSLGILLVIILQKMNLFTLEANNAN
ncbi:MAG: CPBP family intramembrane metalloprotease [Bacteroidales bacterium]|nr:CPBP family intramembrane metalloprotease [Bacteroidales bacterium]MCB9012688.1 CPBP family intramembrane metalloprotease [Bacteroidales bacterium]